jgi:hypothetical protein
MSHRRFVDGEGLSWVVKVITKGEWQFDPGSDHTSPPRLGHPPLYAGDDPFELSEEELRALLADARPKIGRSGGSSRGVAGRASPFGDIYEPPEKRPPFLDAGEAPARKSPFKDLGEPPEKRSPFKDDG